MDDATHARRDALTQVQHRQDGLFTIAQAVELGFSHSTVRRWVATGRCRRWTGRVRSAPSLPTTWRRQARAVHLDLGPGSVLTGLTAARWWRLSAPSTDVVHVAVPRTHDHDPDVAVGRVVVHRPLTTTPSVVVDGVAVATIPATVLACAAELDDGALEDLVADAVRRRRTSLAAVRAALDDAPSNLTGRGHLRRALGRLDAGSDRNGTGRRSPLETAFARLVRGGGLPEPIWGHRIRVGDRVVELDAAWPQHEVAVELDGHRFHATPAELASDARRQNDLVLSGRRILRFTHDDVHHHADRTLEVVGHALHGRRTAPPPP